MYSCYGYQRRSERPARFFAQVRSTAGFGVLPTGFARLFWLRTSLPQANELMGSDIFDEDQAHQGCDGSCFMRGGDTGGNEDAGALRIDNYPTLEVDLKRSF